MTTPTLLVLGQRVRPLEPVPVVGELLGLKRGQSFRAAESWPLTGSTGARRVIVPRLLDELGIPYEVEEAPDVRP
jgi:hypothetical protein